MKGAKTISRAISEKNTGGGCLTLPFTLVRKRLGTMKYETGQTRAELNSSSAFSEAARVVSATNIERLPLLHLLT